MCTDTGLFYAYVTPRRSRRLWMSHVVSHMNESCHTKFAGCVCVCVFITNIHVYIYTYVCVCVCVCVSHMNESCHTQNLRMCVCVCACGMTHSYVVWHVPFIDVSFSSYRQVWLICKRDLCLAWLTCKRGVTYMQKRLLSVCNVYMTWQ
jgi:hypothetical protein